MIVRQSVYLFVFADDAVCLRKSLTIMANICYHLGKTINTYTYI